VAASKIESTAQTALYGVKPLLKPLIRPKRHTKAILKKWPYGAYMPLLMALSLPILIGVFICIRGLIRGLDFSKVLNPEKGGVLIFAMGLDPKY